MTQRKILSLELKTLYENLRRVRDSKKIFKAEATAIQKDDTVYVSVKEHLANAKKLISEYVKGSDPLTPDVYLSRLEELEIRSEDFRTFQQRERESYFEGKRGFEKSKEQERQILRKISLQKKRISRRSSNSRGEFE
jgi:NhaP-type Na+/H+ and K+/H+ antiporter